MSLRIGIGLPIIPTAARPSATTAPVNVGKPTFDGILTQGQSADVNPGSWTGLPSPVFAYAIKRGGVTISTNPNYVWTSADVAAGANAITVEVTATNDVGPTTAVSDPVTIAAPLQLTGTPAEATVGALYSFTPTRTGGHAPFGFDLSGTLPAGLTFEDADGSIVGTPLASGSASLSIGVGDADGLSAVLGPFELTVATAPAFVVRRDTFDISWYGSSTTSGNQDGTGVSSSTLMAGVPGSKGLFNDGVGGSDTSLTTGVRKKMSEASAARKAGTSIIQYDTNDWVSGGDVGVEIQHIGDFISSAVTFLDPAAVSGKRFIAWAGTEYTYAAPGNTRNRRFQRLLWSQYPGQVLNIQEYWARAPIDPTFVAPSGPFAGATDTTTKANGQVPISYQVADRGHLRAKGYEYFFTSWQKDFVEALESGGCPFFAIYPYYTTLSTAQTLGGNVVQLAWVGSLSGVTLAVETLEGGAHPHFGISSGAMLTRVSGTVLTRQFEEFVLRVTRNGITKRYYQKVSIGSLTTAPQRKLIDGHMFGSLETNDYGGTLAAPTFNKATCRAWQGLGAGPFYEISIVMDYEPTTDGDDYYIFYQITGTQLRRTSTNQMRFLFCGDDGVSAGSVSASGATVAGGRQYWFYSAKVDAAAYQELIGDIGVSAPRTTVNSPTPTKPNIGLNPLVYTAPKSAQTYVFSNAGPSGANGVTMPSTSGIAKAKAGFIWMAAAAIDFSVEANRLLFRSGLNSPVDLGVAESGKRPGDGRSVIVQAGGRGLNVGATITPFFYDRGGAADFGKNFGTGGDFEVWNRRDPTGADASQGVAVTL